MDMLVSPQNRIQSVPSQPQVTPTNKGGGEFGRVLANTALASAEGAVMTIPGAPIMALALRNATGSSSSFLTSPGVGAGSVGGAPLGGSATLASTNAAGGPAPTTDGGGASGTPSLEGSLQGTHDANMYYLQIQERVNAENRSFTTISNVLKAEHETVKTAIGNIR